MDQHMTYDKEKMLKEEQTEGEKGQKPRFIWSYIIKPARKDYTEGKWIG